MKNSELVEMINPAVFTSRACLMGSAANGDRDAEKLLERLKRIEKLDEVSIKAESKEKEALYRFSSVYGASVWVRNKISDRIFNSLKMTTFVDLGCGISQRGLALSRRGYVTYYGIDLPPVTEKIELTIKPEIRSSGAANRIIYHTADVTDYNAVRSIIQSDDPLYIVTDGLMMYLTESEMTTVVDNISSLLSEFGGVWATGDAEESVIYDNLLRSMFGGSSQDSSLANSLFSEKWQKLLFDNTFVSPESDIRREFLSKHGLNCREFGVSRIINDLDIPDKIREAFNNSKYLLMSPQDKTGSVRNGGNFLDRLAFYLGTSVTGSSITIGVNGRLDSLNAPKLVEEYEKYTEGTDARSLILDMSGCTFISSAGIRAVLMLYKRTRTIKNGFSMKNIRPEVLEILNNTGFSEFINDI